MNRMINHQLLPALLLLFYVQLSGQNKSSPQLLNLFIDCIGWCDNEYFKQELTYVNFMQDRRNADVFIQITNRRTSSGGREYQLRVLGQNRFESSPDTIQFYTSPDATDNIRRTEILGQVKIAILPYLLQTDLRKGIVYSLHVSKDEQAIDNRHVNDPWNFWVVTLRTNSWFNGQERSRSMNINNSVSVNRTTENHKFGTYLSYSLNENHYKLSDEETAVSKRENAGGYLYYVKSLGNFLSAGFLGGFRSSTFSNIDFSGTLKPTLEYNLFPYEESSQHQFVFRYGLGPVYRNYQDSTVFDQLEEWLGEQELAIQFVDIKDWGTLNVEFQIESYLQDWEQMNVKLSPELEWNIAKGLNVNLGASVSYISNLRNIQKTELSNQDIILQNRQLDTNFEYRGNVGLSYRFGSSYNNIVNPRFN